jgi:hypothetical protein
LDKARREKFAVPTTTQSTLSFPTRAPASAHADLSHPSAPRQDDPNGPQPMEIDSVD